MSDTTALRQRARKWEKGHFFEDFTVGRVFEHHWGRTILESDTMLFTTLTLGYNPLYFNREYAKAHGYGDLVVNPFLVFAVTFGLSVEDLSETGGAFLGVAELSFHRAVTIGETLTARSTVVEARPSRSRPHAGVVTWHTEGLAGDGIVVDFRRTNLISKRDTRREL
ncbi:MAG: MaoC family dehydratase [Streptosporangiaceae bacterium]